MKNGLKDASQENLHVLGEILHDFRIGMMTTVSGTGEVSSRPMYLQQVDENGDLWFLTSTKSFLIEQVRENPRLMVTFADPHKNKYLERVRS